MNAAEAATYLGNVYARAILELATDASVAEPVREDLISIRHFLGENPELVTIVGSPWFTQQYKAQLLGKLFSGNVNELTFDFLMVAADHNRLMFLPQMISSYMEMYNAQRGIRTVRATVSNAASIDIVRQLRPKVSQILKSEVEFDFMVDPSILGGLVLRYGEKIIDNSTRTRLNRAIMTIMKRQYSQG